MLAIDKIQENWIIRNEKEQEKCLFIQMKGKQTLKMEMFKVMEYSFFFRFSRLSDSNVATRHISIHIQSSPTD